jgi:uncharacterized protein
MRDYPIIDMDIHPHPSRVCPLDPFIPEYAHLAIKQSLGKVPTNGYNNPAGGASREDAACFDPAAVLVDHFERYDIAYGLIQPPGMAVSLTTQIDAGNAMAIAWNDWQIAHWLDFDPRYLGSVCVNMNDPQAAAAEIRRVGKHKQMVTVVVCGESADLYGHRRYWPVYEAISEMGLAFTLHPGNEGALRSPTPVGRPPTYFEWHTLIPLTFQAHLVSLIAEGVFEKFPKLKLVLCEGGVAWLIHTMWRMEKNFKGLRASVPWMKRLPSEYIFDHVRFTSQPIEEPEKPEQFLQLLEMIKAEKTLLFATDFPHWDFDDPDRVFPRKIDPKLLRRILYENAAELFGLPTLEQKLAERPTAGAR